jgi:hypothetical protein
MQYLKVKNKKIINQVYKDELKRLVYKSVFFNTKLDKKVRQESFMQLSRLTQLGSISYLKPRCF